MGIDFVVEVEATALPGTGDELEVLDSTSDGSNRFYRVGVVRE